MTVASQVKQSLHSLKSAEHGLKSLSFRTINDDAKQVYYESAAILNEVVVDLDHRIGVLEREEPQYKGF